MTKSRALSSIGLVAIGAVLAASGTAVAATGGTFVLGRGNAASTTTALRNSGADATLTLQQSRTGQAPLSVSSWSGKAPNLNSDKLDGLDSTAFALAGGKVGTIEAVADGEDFTGDGVVDVYVAYARCPAGSKVTGGGFEVFTGAGALISRADTNGWLAVTVPDAESVADDLIVTAQCYSPRGAVTGAVESFSTPVLSEQELARLLRFAAAR